MISRTTPPSPQADARLPEHATKRTELLEVHPVYWLNSRGNTWPWITWAAVVSAWAAATLVPASLLREIGVSTPLVFLSVPFASLLLTAPARIEVGIQASRFFAEARRTGALELLLCTPLTTEEIVNGHWLTLRRRFFAPVAAVVGLVLVLLVFGVVEAGSDFILFAVFTAGKCLFLVAAFVADLFAAGWVGMLMGLTAKKPSQAAGLTVLYTVALPAFAFCVPDLLVSVPLLFWARDKLRRELRALSNPRYTPVTPLYSHGHKPSPQPPVIRV